MRKILISQRHHACRPADLSRTTTAEIADNSDRPLQIWPACHSLPKREGAAVLLLTMEGGGARMESSKANDQQADLRALLEEVFETYASDQPAGGSQNMLGAAAWRRMMEECKVVDEHVPLTLLDQLFRDAGGGQPVRFPVFLTILSGVANEKYGDDHDALEKICKPSTLTPKP
jgi:hypothetical protein